MTTKSNNNSILPENSEKVKNSKTAFFRLLTAYATAYASKATDPTAYSTALTDLATAIAYSVLKKCIDTSSNPTLKAIRRDLAKASHDLGGLKYANNNAYTLEFNESGDLTRKTLDPDLAKAFSMLATDTLGDGLDLVNTAVIAVLEETNKQVDRDPDLPIDLERPYTVRRLNKKVWIKSADSVGGWETVETSPIREIYKAVRRAIDSSRAAVTDPRNGYSYLEDLATDPESETETVIYRRLPKYADLGGYATDFNGAMTAYTIDPSTVNKYENLVETLNLTARQMQVLKLRISGYGYKAIATYLAIRPDSVRDCVKAIQNKAIKAGFAPSKYTETPTATAPTETPTAPTATAPTEKMYIDIPTVDFETVYTEYQYNKWLKEHNIFNHR